MNLPNKLTILRIALVPFFVAAMLLAFPFRYLVALALFGVASLTDMLDGKIARKYGLVTNFGKFMDPLADKVLVMAALICFIPCFGLSAVAVIIIMAREFLVTSLRLVASSEGLVIAADKWGKVKTASTMVWICITLFLAGVGIGSGLFHWVFNIGASLVTLVTVLSGANYLAKNRSILNMQ
ncbi:MAG: CDP-diacylglycerol--glycerol-3-phosphate 3-phosphatidyltransferase [Oscillospiraceae bacterium]|nr:CDP-diacylglycerol--glycerol-3-phosphate 3-phosphatidyltransferase [Oscillospiraceae bacterium]